MSRQRRTARFSKDGHGHQILERQNRAFVLTDLDNVFGGVSLPRASFGIPETQLFEVRSILNNVQPHVSVRFWNVAFAKTFLSVYNISPQVVNNLFGHPYREEGIDGADKKLEQILLSDPAIESSSDLIIVSGDKRFVPIARRCIERGQNVHLVCDPQARARKWKGHFSTYTELPGYFRRPWEFDVDSGRPT